MEKYLLLLFDQFKKTQGMDNKAKIDNYKSEFFDWVSTQKAIKGNYAKLLTNMDISGELIAELGKGFFDSIVPNLNGLYVEAIAITPFAETFKDSNLTVLNGEIVLLNGNAIINYNDSNNMLKYPNCNELINRDIRTLITQLPYNGVDITALVESSRQYNDVAIGSYGNTNDKDAYDKVQLLRRIKDIIESQYCVGCDEELITDNGTYKHIILSHQKRLIKK
jgi:hypothetical protein